MYTIHKYMAFTVLLLNSSSAELIELIIYGFIHVAEVLSYVLIDVSKVVIIIDLIKLLLVLLALRQWLLRVDLLHEVAIIKAVIYGHVVLDLSEIVFSDLFISVVHVAEVVLGELGDDLLGAVGLLL